METKNPEAGGAKVAIMGHFPISTVRAIDALARARDTKRSVLLRLAVGEYVERHRDELPTPG